MNNIAGIGYLYPPVAVAPGQLTTVFVTGSVQDGVSVTVTGSPIPVLEVRPGSACSPATLCAAFTGITIQIPYEIEPRCFFTDPSCLVIAPTPLVVTVNGVAGAAVNLEPVADRIHFLTACDTVVPSGNGIAPLNGLSCQPLVMHADGSPVTQASPAQGTEELVAYAVGLGLTNPAVPTGQASATAIPTYEDFLLDFNFRPNALATQPILPAFLAATGLATNLNTPLFSGLVPGYVGLYQINFIVPPHPAGIEACSGAVQSNLTVSLGGQSSFDGAGICIAP